MRTHTSVHTDCVHTNPCTQTAFTHKAHKYLFHSRAAQTTHICAHRLCTHPHIRGKRSHTCSIRALHRPHTHTHTHTHIHTSVGNISIPVPFVRCTGHTHTHTHIHAHTHIHTSVGTIAIPVPFVRCTGHTHTHTHIRAHRLCTLTHP